VGFRQRRTITGILFLGSVLAVFLRLRQCFDPEWGPIAGLMFHPGAVPVFGHRLLFVGVAWIFRLAGIVSTDARYCYYLSQIVALLWSFFMVGWLVRETAGEEMEYAAYPLLALLLLPTLDYFTYYDLAIPGFYAACLVLLLKGRHGLFLGILTLGMLNHENLILMAGVGVLSAFRNRNYPLSTLLAGASLGIYAAERQVLQKLLPLAWTHMWNWPENVHPIDTYGLIPLCAAALALLLPLACMVVGFRYSHPLLKIGAPVVLLGLTVAGALFGQWNESRMFDPLFAFSVPMLLSVIGKTTAGSLQPREPAPDSTCTLVA